MSSASLLLLSNALFFAFSALGILASVTIFFLARETESRSDRDLEAYKVQASAEISHARVEVEQAKAHAASELADAALANQRSAALELELQKEKSASDDKIDAHIHHDHTASRKPIPRSIHRPVNISLSVGMSDTDISIVSEAGNEESKNLARSIRSLFDGGSLVSMDHAIGPDSGHPVAMAGVHIYRSEDAEAQRISKMLFDVLSKNNIRSDLTNVAGNGSARSMPGRPGSKSVVTIYVGRKPDH